LAQVRLKQFGASVWLQLGCHTTVLHALSVVDIMRKSIAFAVASLSVLVTSSDATKKTVVITGATGATGNLLYKRLVAENVYNVRACVRNATKAKDLLKCTKCDESEGIFEGDIKKPDSLTKVMTGADVLVILTGSAPACTGVFPFSKCTYHEGAYPVDLEFKGTKNQIAAFAKNAGGDLSSKQLMYMSTMGTTGPNTFLDKFGNGHTSFYHLQAEVLVLASGIPYFIPKACGLSNGEGGTNHYRVGHDDSTFSEFTGVVKRDDVARLFVEAIRSPEASNNLRFDTCSSVLPWDKKTTDIEADVFKAARYPWAKAAAIKADAVIQV